MKLWKTQITIWSDEDPKHLELEHLAREAQSGSSYCSKQETTVVEDAEKDEDWDGCEFFDMNIDTDDIITVQEIRYIPVYEALTEQEQVDFLMFHHSLSEKEAWEYRTDSAYDLPYPIASEFEDFDDSKYPDENR